MVFNYENRRKLELYMQKKVTVTRIAKVLNISRASIYNELKKGLSEEDLKSRKYSNYSADIAQENVEKKVIERIR